MRNKIGIVLLLLIIIPGFVFAQSSTGGRRRGASTVSLTVTANVQAQVEIRTAGTTKDALANASTYQGRTPFTQADLAKGAYTVTVSANGYESQTRQIDLQDNQTINFNLQQINFQLRVISNVPAAQIYINNQSVGRGSVTQTNRPGNYRVRVTASGYNEFNTTVNLNEDKVVNVVLQPSMGTVNIDIPATVLDPRVNNAVSQVRIFVDGTQQNATTLQLRPGRHAIRISSGGLSSEKMIDVRAGEVYTIEVFMGFNVNSN